MDKIKKLEDYLEQINHYLGVEKGGKEILSEIKSHILEKTENEFGEINDQTVEKIIAGYGSPRRVAETYMEGYQIIAPVFKKHLFVYAGILFAFHYGFTILSYIFDIRIQMFPIFITPRMENIFDLIGMLPTILVFDIGLVVIILYIVTQQKKEVHLPWPKFSGRKPRKVLIKEPKIIVLLILVALFCAACYVFLRFHSLFFLSLDLKNIRPLFNQPAATLYSLAVIFLFGMEIIAYIIRFFRNDLIFVLELVKNGIYLIVIWFIHNYPMENVLAVKMDFEIKFFSLPITWGVALIIVLDSLFVVYKLIRQKQNQVKKGDRA